MCRLFLSAINIQVNSGDEFNNFAFHVPPSLLKRHEKLIRYFRRRLLIIQTRSARGSFAIINDVHFVDENKNSFGN